MLLGQEPDQLQGLALFQRGELRFSFLVVAIGHHF